MSNTQPPEKFVPSDGTKLDVHSTFNTIQGEGPFSGYRAFFIRLAGCNLQCPGCDTEYTQGRAKVEISSIVERARMSPAGLVVITGGEPFRQNIAPLVKALIAAGKLVQIETNGTLPQSPELPNVGCYVVCSPKTPSINQRLASRANAFKYVVDADNYDERDGLPTIVLGNQCRDGAVVARPPVGAKIPVFIQPADVKDAEQNLRNNATAVRSCLETNRILQLQIHKLIGVE